MPVPIPMMEYERLNAELDILQSSIPRLNAELGDDAVADAYNLTYNALKMVNGLIHSIDNAIEFCRLGGLHLVRVLMYHHSVALRAATLQLIGDVVQNNDLCQKQVLNVGIAEDLLVLLKTEKETLVIVKTLYAMSCLCRGNNEALYYLKEWDLVELLLALINHPVETVKMKSSFLLSYFVDNEPSVKEFLCNSEFVSKLCSMICEEHQVHHEYLLCMLVKFLEHSESVRQIVNKIPCLEMELKRKLVFYQSAEFDECRLYCQQIMLSAFA